MDADWVIRVEAAKLAMELTLAQNSDGTVFTKCFLLNFIGMRELLSGQVTAEDALATLADPKSDVGTAR